SGAEPTELACPLCIELSGPSDEGSESSLGLLGRCGWSARRKTPLEAYGGSRNGRQVGPLFAARYEIQSVLGKGGMGTVYKAHDRELDELVAIKTLRHPALWADPFRLDRFKQEIRLARRITHANVLRTHDLGEWNGLKFISMEFVEGQTLEQVLESEGILPTPVALRIARQVCAGLAAAHKVGVIHGDIQR